MKRTEADMDPWQQARAQEARWNPTPSEARLWALIQPMGFKNEVPVYGYTKNGGVYPYRLDLFHPKARLVIEIDGSSHDKRKGRDRRRDTRLATEGIQTIRFIARQVMNNCPNVVEQIQAIVERRLLR